MLDAGRIADEVEARLESHRQHLREYFAGGGVPVGLARPSDEEFAEFVMSMIAQHPPIPLRFPVLARDGTPVLDPLGEPAYEERFISPWLAMLDMKRRRTA